MADCDGVTTIDVTGDLSINDGATTGTSSLTVDLTDWCSTSSLELIDVDGAVNGTFASVNLINAPAGSSLVIDFEDGNDIAIVVPEPSTMVLIVLAGLAIVGIRRRK